MPPPSGLSLVGGDFVGVRRDWAPGSEVTYGRGFPPLHGGDLFSQLNTQEWLILPERQDLTRQDTRSGCDCVCGQEGQCYDPPQ